MAVSRLRSALAQLELERDGISRSQDRSSTAYEYVQGKDLFVLCSSVCRVVLQLKKIAIAQNVEQFIPTELASALTNALRLRFPVVFPHRHSVFRSSDANAMFLRVLDVYVTFAGADFTTLHVEYLSWIARSPMMGVHSHRWQGK